MQGVEGYPVRAFAHNFNAVDNEAEITVLTVCRIGALKLYPSYTEGSLLFVDKLTARIDTKGRVINVRLAVTAGPP
jgi:hypothetical protein